MKAPGYNRLSGRPSTAEERAPGIVPGRTYWLGREASVQFSDDRKLLFRVIKVTEYDTYDGWVWLLGYALDENGEAVERRELFVQPAGMVPADRPATRYNGKQQ